LLVAATAAVVTYAVAAAALPTSGSPPTSYGGASIVARVTDLAAGVGLLAAGLAALYEPRRRRLGVLAIGAGVAWFGPDWEGWANGPALVRSLGALAPPLFLALVLHLALAFPGGRVGTRAGRAVLGASYAIAVTATGARAAFRDPIGDAYCWRNCKDNVFAVHDAPGLARGVGDAWLVAAVAIGVVLVVVAVLRLGRATTPAALRLVAPGVVAGALVGAASTASAAVLLRRPLEEPRSAFWLALFLALSLATVAVAAAVAWSAARVRRTRAAIAGLARDLAESAPPGRLRDALAAAVGDPTLEVAYRRTGSDGFVDADGRERDPPAPRDGRAVTPILRGGAVVAAIVHDSSLRDVPGLAREIGSAVRLAIDNERLRAELLAELETLRGSRARIVAAGDDERRRLERNLHDGAQRLLLALVYELQVIAGDDTVLVEARREAQAAVDELRRLAHGIYPAVLTESGLGAALLTLAETAPLPVEVRRAPATRYPEPVESATYVVVAEAVDDAAARHASFVGVDVRSVEDRLVVVAEDDGEADARRTPPLHVRDRVGALGGTVELAPPTLRVEIPCA
jgi:signal transduction histidine kinase